MESRLFIMDAATNSVTATTTVVKDPDQIAFTEHYAYVRGIESEKFTLIERQGEIPEADEATCRRYFEANRARFTAGAVYVAGACLGSLVFGQLTDRFGRKKLFLITLGVYTVATVLTAFSMHPWWYFGARFLTRGGATECPEGKFRSRVVVIEFPTYQAAQACYRSEEYARAIAARQGRALIDLAIIEGYDGPQPSDG